MDRSDTNPLLALLLALKDIDPKQISKPQQDYLANIGEQLALPMSSNDWKFVQDCISFLLGKNPVLKGLYEKAQRRLEEIDDKILLEALRETQAEREQEIAADKGTEFSSLLASRPGSSPPEDLGLRNSVIDYGSIVFQKENYSETINNSSWLKKLKQRLYYVTP